MQSIPWKTLIPAVLGFVALTAALTLGISLIGLDRIREIVQSAGIFAPLLYVLVRAATFIAAPLNSGPLQFAAGVMFGLIPGTLLSLLGELIGGTGNFWIARRLGRPAVLKLAGDEGMQKIDRFYTQVGDIWTLVYARLFLFALYDFVSYAAGFTPMKYRQYAIVTVLAGIPVTAAAVFIGTTLTGDSTHLIVLYAVLGVLCVLPLLFYPRVRRWFERGAQPAP